MEKKIKNYIISVSVKLPIPRVNYSNIGVDVSVEGPDYEAVAAEAMSRAIELQDTLTAYYAEQTAPDRQ